MIKVENISKIFGDKKVLDNVSFEVNKGEVVGFLGPNGAGKTTTMRIITGYLSPSSGNVLVNGQKVKEDLLNIKKQIGYLPENNPVYKELKVYENLIFFAKIKGVPREKVKNEIKQIAELCGLENVVNQSISTLSKGYRQRVGLAQALLNNPSVLILDEPTSGLDPNQIVDIRNLIKKIGEKRTVIISTHILSEVQAMCARIVVINNGIIVGQGTPEELAKKQQGALIIEAFISGNSEEIIKKFSSLDQVENITVISSESFSENKYSIVFKEKESVNCSNLVFDTVVGNNWKISELNTKQTSLEDVFRNLTSG